VAFARRHGEREVVVIVPRLVVGLMRGKTVEPVGAEVWGTTRLPIPGTSQGVRYRDVFTGEEIGAGAEPGTEGQATLALAEAFAVLPFALLERVGEGGGE